VQKSSLVSSARKGNFAWVGRLALPLLVLTLAVLAYGLYGFDGVLLRDYSIYLYSGQMVAEGVPPYVSAFDHKGPLSSMIAGLGVVLSQPLGWDDVYTVRLIFFTTACLGVVAVYLLGASVFRSRVAGFLAALTLLGCYGFAQPAGSGPEPKTPLVLFEALSLLFATQKRWFWSGLFGSLALLVWQPMAVFAFVTFLLAVTRPRGERGSAVLRTLAGISLPLAAVLAYFYYHGALGDLLDGFVLFNFLYLVRGHFNLAYHVAGAAINIALPYGTMLIPIIIGLGAILRLYVKRPYEYRFAPILLSLPAPVLWSLRDFQLADDFYVFLPYATIGFGAFLAAAIRRTDAPRVLTALMGAILLTIALANTWGGISAAAAERLLGTDIDLPTQREGALEIEERFGEDAKLISINSPQVLVLLHRENPNPYIWTTAGVDRLIEAKTEGGFEGWLEELEAYDPDAISFFGEGQSLLPSHHLSPENVRALDTWLDTRYRAEKIGPWWFFVKKELSSGEAGSFSLLQSQ
jgi:DolP-mannose mannosyltransferase